MKLEQGKFYCTRDGRKVGPVYPYANDMWHDPTGSFPDASAWWEPTGKRGGYSEDPSDLVEKAAQTWGEMTVDEKKELLFAHYQGEQIQYLSSLGWRSTTECQWFDCHAYRVKPKIQVLTCSLVHPTFSHCVTIETTDGVLDWSSIKRSQ